MTKAFIKYFLFTFILFYSGVSHALSNSQPSNTVETQQSEYIQAELPGPVADAVTASIFISKSRHHLEPYEVELEEEDDEKTNSIKRHSNSGKHFLVLCFGLVLGYFHEVIKKRSPSCESSYYLSIQKRFILFQVFRI